MGVVERPVHRLDDRSLLELVLRRIGRIGGAVVEPRIDVERHVDDVDADVRAVGQRIRDRAQEQEAAVLAAADADQLDAGSHPGNAKAIRRSGDRARDMGAVAAVVHGRRIDAGRDLARSIDERDVGDEVPGKPRRELAGKVGMRGVDAGIEDADKDAAVTGVDGPGRDPT